MVLPDILKVEKPIYKICKNGPKQISNYSKITEICFTD